MCASFASASTGFVSIRICWLSKNGYLSGSSMLSMAIESLFSNCAHVTATNDSLIPFALKSEEYRGSSLESRLPAGLSSNVGFPLNNSEDARLSFESISSMLSALRRSTPPSRAFRWFHGSRLTSSESTLPASKSSLLLQLLDSSVWASGWYCSRAI